MGQLSLPMAIVVRMTGRIVACPPEVRIVLSSITRAVAWISILALLCRGWMTNRAQALPRWRKISMSLAWRDEVRAPVSIFKKAAPVVPAFCVLGADRRYTISLGEPIRVAAEGETAALRAWVSVLEEAVRRHPEQWFNFFDCWRTPAAR